MTVLVLVAALAFAPEMVIVTAGCFYMGASSGADDPKHKVCLEAYQIDRTEVTNRAYAACVAANKCADLSAMHAEWTDGAPWDVPDEPVVGVTWKDADGYCRSVGKRLPSEVEWEYAARGSDGRTYPWGNELDCSRANYGAYPKSWNCKPAWCNEVIVCRGKNPGRPAKVGSYPTGASPFGALDMAGNVAEWVDDWYDLEAYYQGGPSKDAIVWKVQRGGYWYGPAAYVEAADRDKDKPDRQNKGVGFRCARAAAKVP